LKEFFIAKNKHAKMWDLNRAGGDWEKKYYRLKAKMYYVAVDYITNQMCAN